jgi:hypothetical protein
VPLPVERYIEVLQRYLALLQQHGLQVAPTTPVPVHTKAGGHVVYLLQPRLDPAGLASQLLRPAGDRVLLECVDGVLAHAGGAVRSVSRWSCGQQFGKAGRCKAVAAKGGVQCAR